MNWKKRVAILLVSFALGSSVGWLSYVLTHPAFAQPVFLDVCLSLTGTNAQARAAIRVLGLEKEMIQPGVNPNDPVASFYSHDVAIDLWERPILQFAVRDDQGNEITPPVFAADPIMRIRFVSDEAKAKARTNIVDVGALPAGLEKTLCPTTRVWAGG